MDELLIDTTYLLPVFGVSTGLENYEQLFPMLLNKYSVLYNPISTVEAKWIILKLARREARGQRLLTRFREGLKALLSDKRLSQSVLTNHEIEEIADILLVKEEVKDYFDRLIYATAAHHNAILLTEDKKLLRITRQGNLPKPKKALNWSELAKELRHR